MILRDNSNLYNSLYHLSLRWARSDDENFTFDDFIASLNMAINRLTAVIQRHDETWKWKDSNAATATLLDASTTLQAGVNAYPISAPWLAISRVRILLPDGVTWKTLANVDRRQVSDAQMVSGDMWGYYMLGGLLYLVGTPTYGFANGIEVQFKTGATHFTPADTDETVGYDPTFEELAALMPALDYLDINGPEEQAMKVREKIGIEPRQGIEGSGLLNALALAYTSRNDAPQVITLKRSPRATGLLYGDGSGPLNPGYFPPPTP